MSAMESASTFNARLAEICRCHVRWTASPRILSGYAAAVIAKLRAVAPYALIELVLPGGSVMALLLWLYRRQRNVPVFASQEILALL
jgi:hypothetical protein